MKRRGARLGQHFLNGSGPARTLAHAAGIGTNDTVLEIGPGTGILTRELLATGAHVVAIEKDEALASKLEGIFSREIASGALKVITADVRDVTPKSIGLRDKRYVLAANIPYYITGEIIRQFLTAPTQPRTMALLVQKEVAERIVSTTESILSLSVKAYGKPRMAGKIGRGNFSPPPSVDSAILVVENISRDFFVGIDEASFFKIVRAGFSSKRKFLANNLSGVLGKEKTGDILSVCGLEPKVRAENVSLEKWKCIASNLSHV